MRVTISVSGDELGDVDVTREWNLRTLSGEDGKPLLADLLKRANEQINRAYSLEETE